MQSGAVQYLSKHNFDFNRWIKTGINYMSDEKYQQQIKIIKEGGKNKKPEKSTDANDERNNFEFNSP